MSKPATVGELVRTRNGLRGNSDNPDSMNKECESLPRDARNRVTCARQEGSDIAHGDVCLGWMEQVLQTNRPTKDVTHGSAWGAKFGGLRA